MKQEKHVLRIEIDGHWEAGEFAASFNALNRLYTLRLGLALELEEFQELDTFDPKLRFYPSIIRSADFQSLRVLRRTILTSRDSAIQRDSLVSGSRISSRISEMIEPKERLTVRRITYGSPGFKDFAGLGEIVGHLKDLILSLLEHYSTKEKRALDNERRKLANEQLKIEIAKGYIGIAQEMGYTKRNTPIGRRCDVRAKAAYQADRGWEDYIRERGGRLASSTLTHYGAYCAAFATAMTFRR